MLYIPLQRLPCHLHMSFQHLSKSHIIYRAHLLHRLCHDMVRCLDIRTRAWGRNPSTTLPIGKRSHVHTAPSCIPIGTFYIQIRILARIVPLGTISASSTTSLLLYITWVLSYSRGGGLLRRNDKRSYRVKIQKILDILISGRTNYIQRNAYITRKTEKQGARKWLRAGNFS